ncbi:hypothetical protein BJY00DRAFT_275716 [Aspergillus carlsbadensis]|nr:hypothetical protein BJY00DRAFT_275716 [Aspergillus carlsbadensis]
MRHFLRHVENGLNQGSAVGALALCMNLVGVWPGPIQTIPKAESRFPLLATSRTYTDHPYCNLFIFVEEEECAN